MSVVCMSALVNLYDVKSKPGFRMLDPVKLFDIKASMLFLHVRINVIIWGEISKIILHAWSNHLN